MPKRVLRKCGGSVGISFSPDLLSLACWAEGDEVELKLIEDGYEIRKVRKKK